MDITELILFQHHEQRRMFALLDEMSRDDIEGLGAVWGRLEVLLEVHAEAEEEFFYPPLLRLGRGTPESDVVEEVEDAIKDHNEIRDGIRQVRAAEPGSDEELEDLADFRRHTDLQARHDIAVQFAVFQAKHPQGVPIQLKDPKQYIEAYTAGTA
jgi:hypothetical protein